MPLRKPFHILLVLKILLALNLHMIWNWICATTHNEGARWNVNICEEYLTDW